MFFVVVVVVVFTNKRVSGRIFPNDCVLSLRFYDFYKVAVSTVVELVGAAFVPAAT